MEIVHKSVVVHTFLGAVHGVADQLHYVYLLIPFMIELIRGRTWFFLKFRPTHKPLATSKEVAVFLLPFLLDPRECSRAAQHRAYFRLLRLSLLPFCR